MKRTTPISTSAADLQPHAKARGGKPWGIKSRNTKPDLAKNDSQQLLHELQVHHTELEMQNDELRRTRDEMEAGLEKYSELYDFAPISYLTLDPIGTITEANLSSTHLFGLSRTLLLKKRFSSFVHPADRNVLTEYLSRVYGTKARVECDLRLLLPDRSQIYVRIRATTSNSAHGCRMAITDITEHKQSEEKLRTSEVRYRRLFEAAHDGVLLVDPLTRKIVNANPFMTKLLGYPHQQLIGKELFEIGLLQDASASREMFQRLKTTRQVRYEDLPLRSAGGQHQEVEVVANLYQEDGHPVIQCNIRDITERKQSEEALRRSEALFSALIQQAPVGVYVVDSNFRMQQVNRKAQPIFERIRPLLGRNFSEIVHLVWPKRLADEVEKRFRHTLKTGAAFQSPEFSGQRLDIAERQVYEWQIQRITLPAGENGVVCFFNDITDRKQAEQAQRRMAVMAASNQKLEREIVRRREVELALRKSERNQQGLLDHSNRQQEHLRQLSRQVLRVQEEERKAISRDLHDVVAQALTGINVRLAALTNRAKLSPKDLDRTIVSTQKLVEQSVNIVHTFARELRPAVLDDLGLIPALQSFMQQFSSRTGVRTHLTAFSAIEHLSVDQRTVLYRVAQEALTNVARHAHATHVEVLIRRIPKGISMRIQDDGRSFRVARTLGNSDGKRLGLLGMQERLQMTGGTLTIESSPGKGTTILAMIPLGKASSPRTSGSSAPGR